MTNKTSKPDFDTPADGDFATYVERLNAAAPQAPADPVISATGRSQSSGLDEILEPLLPLQGLLRPARQVVLALMALQVLALLLFSSGSFMNLLTLGFVWWALGRLALELARLSTGAKDATIDPHALREGWQRLVARLKSIEQVKSKQK